MREETRCRHMGYSFRLATRVLLYASSRRQDNTYHGLCYTSRGALPGTRNNIKFINKTCQWNKLSYSVRRPRIHDQSDKPLHISYLQRLVTQCSEYRKPTILLDMLCCQVTKCNVQPVYIYFFDELSDYVYRCSSSSDSGTSVILTSV